MKFLRKKIYIEIELSKRANYDAIYDYIYQLQIYMQLYRSNKFLINKIFVMIDGEYYGLINSYRKMKYKEKHIQITVEEELLDFLKRCYTLIPYRNSKTEIRNSNENYSVIDLALEYPDWSGKEKYGVITNYTTLSLL